MNINPPKYAERLLLWFLRPDLAEEVSGDLHEKFILTTKAKSPFRAQLNYWYQVFHYIRPFAIKKLYHHIIHYAMLQSNIKIGWRHLISCVIAIPIAWYFMHNWLKAYEYRTDISWWVFALTGAGALLITLLTVSYQAVKAALMNPVRSLRSE